MTQRRMWEVVPLLPLSLSARHRFAYQSPSPPPGGDLTESLTVGALVRIPFSHRVARGIVWRELRSAPHGRPLKSINRVLSRRPLFTKVELDALQQLAALSLEPLPGILQSATHVREPLEHLLSEHHGSKKGSTPGFTLSVRFSSIAETLPQRSVGQALILCPELALGRRVLALLEARGISAVLFAQTLTLRERRESARRLARHDAVAVVATHAGVFLPLSDLSAILVVEAALPSHRQWDLHPRYDARLAAFLIAKAKEIPVVFQSTLPSLDLAALARWRSDAPLHPTIAPGTFRVVFRKWTDPLLLPESIAEIRRIHEDGGTLFLFHDVVGTERMFGCDTCGFPIRCLACGGSLERRAAVLVCRVCRTLWGRVPLFCPRCKSPHIGPRRFGTESLERELRYLVPAAPIGRVDRQTLPRRRRTDDVPAVASGSIVIGSEQAVGVLPPRSFDHVFVVDADHILTSLSFDAAERFARVLLRLADLRHRPDRPVLLQTAHPNQLVVRALASGNFGDWLEQERTDRELLSYPPSAVLLRVETPRGASTRLAARLRRVSRELQKRVTGCRVGIRVGGPLGQPSGELLIRGSLPAVRVAEHLLPTGWRRDPHVPLSLVTTAPGRVCIPIR